MYLQRNLATKTHFLGKDWSHAGLVKELSETQRPRIDPSLEPLEGACPATTLISNFSLLKRETIHFFLCKSYLVYCYHSLRKLILMWHLGHTGSSVCPRWEKGVQRQRDSQHVEITVCESWNKVLGHSRAHFLGMWIPLVFRYFSDFTKKYSLCPPQILKQYEARFMPLAS